MNDPFKLNGKAAIVTGGAGDGIGHGLSTVLAERGAAVLIADIDTTRTVALAEKLIAGGYCAHAFTVDVRSDASVKAMVELAVERFGGVDILVSSAGIGMIDHPESYDAMAFENVLEVNLKGVLRCCRQVVGPMRARGGGSIINISSVHAEATMPGYVFYTSTKSAVVGMTRGLAIDLGPDRIRVNSVLPGLVDCKQTRDVVALTTSGTVDDWIREYVQHNQAVPFSIAPADVGQLVAFLASDAARAITGAEYIIDGGSLAFLQPRQ